MGDKQFCVAVTSGVALGAFVVFMVFLPDFLARLDWPLCDGANCNVQVWLGSLSGWFGGFATFITILLIVYQLREQRRQTDFLIGDARPTMDAIEHLEDKAQLVVRIVNWNRRGMVVRSLKVEDPNSSIMPNRLTVNGVKIPVDIISFGIDPFVIPGWVDRSASPPQAEIRLSAITMSDTSLRLSPTWLQHPHILADIQLLGDAHKAILLKADTRLLLEGL